MMRLLAAAVQPARPNEFKLKLSPTPPGLDAAEFELWIPEALPAERPVRGVLCSSHYHAGASVYETQEWRDIAARHDFAILQALTEMAPMARRPESAPARASPYGRF